MKAQRAGGEQRRRKKRTEQEETLSKSSVKWRTNVRVYVPYRGAGRWGCAAKKADRDVSPGTSGDIFKCA